MQQQGYWRWIGEPIELTALRRITDPAAVEEADTRGLITLEPVVLSADHTNGDGVAQCVLP